MADLSGDNCEHDHHEMDSCYLCTTCLTDLEKERDALKAENVRLLAYIQEKLPRVDPNETFEEAVEAGMKEHAGAMVLLRISELEDNNRVLQVEVARLRVALGGLIKINEDHNKAMEEITGTPLGWKDSYLDDARAALDAGEDKHCEWCQGRTQLAVECGPCPECGAGEAE